MIINFIKKNIFILILLAFIVVPVISFAQSCPGGMAPSCPGGMAPPCANGVPATCNNPLSTSVQITDPINATTINDFIKTILEGVIKIGIPIVTLAIIYSGFLFVAARGNSEKLEHAKQALLYSVIGAAILLGSWAIAQLIANTVLSL